MTVTLIQAPYHLGRDHVGLGRGVPVLADALAGDGVEPLEVERGHDFLNEIAASFDVVRGVAERVGEAVAAGRLPVVLAGNCNSAALGTAAGLGTPDDLGVVWLDAHADFQTTDTTASGFFDGMALTMLTGTGWTALRAGIEGLRPVPAEHVVLVGARDLSPAEEGRLAASRVRRVGPGEPLEPALEDLAARVSSIYLHVDLDVLDPLVGRANWYAAPGGLDLDEVVAAVELVGRCRPIRAAALTAYAPECDPERSIPAAARAIFEGLGAASRGGAPA